MKKERLSIFLDNSVGRFILVGCVNTLVGCMIMFGLYNLAGVGYWPSSAANYVLTSILSFFLNKYFTFKNHTNSLKQVGRFIANILFCYLIAYGIAVPLVKYVLADAPVVLLDNISMLVGMVLFTAFNYVGQRFYAFRIEG